MVERTSPGGSGPESGSHEYPGFSTEPPAWKGRSKLSLLLAVTGGIRPNLRKLRNAIELFAAYARPKQAQRRLRRLEKMGHIDTRPTLAQLWLAARDQVFLKSAVDTKLMYEKKGIPWTFHNLRRFLAEPTTFMDPVGVYANADTITNHILQVVHHNPLYDMELLNAREGGLDELERQLNQLDAGTHVHQESLSSLVEEADYWSKLRKQLADFRDCPTQTRYPDLSGYEPDMGLAVDQFKDVRGYTNYASRLEATGKDVALAVFEVLFNYSVGIAVGETIGPETYRHDCCDPELRTRFGL